MALDTSKIIHAPVGGGRYTVTAPIVKEDYGLYLLIEGLELPSTYEVDFSNSEHNGTSVTMIGNADGVLIPSQFIKSGKDVFAFLYHVGEDYGRTIFKFRIPNKLRPDRTAEQPTPEQQSVIDQAIAALNDAVEQTAQDVIDADASERMALGYAESAQESARQAQEYSTVAISNANSASQSASQASASATASAQSASQSAQIKTDVEDLVDDAQASASASALSATASANSASQASASATSASQSATSAQGYASQAQTSAQTASSKAQDASTSAQTASQKATEASQSASQALTYKTDAESAKTSAQTAQTSAESARDSAISAKDDAEDARDEAQTIVDGISGKVEQIDSNTERIESLEDDRYKPYAVDSASGAIASFVDGADDIPLKSLVVNIDPVQDLHGYDSPWVGGGGKNLLDPTLLKDQVGWNVINLQLKPSTQYVMSANIDNLLAMPIYFTNDSTQGSGSKVYSGHPVVKTSTEEGIIQVIQRRVSGEDSFQNYHFQIEEGNTVTDWTPYENICPISGWTEVAVNHSDADMTNPTTLTIQLGQTVYGGKLDVLSGVMTVYPYYASYNGETLTGEWISDRDKYVSGTTPTIGAQVVNIGAQGTEIQLEPHEVKSLLGANNIFADTGDTSAEYRADTTLYIQRLTEPDTDMIADANIVSGQYFMVGNSLFKATANIASGSAVIVGTNAIRKSLSEALNEINA